MSMFKDFYIYHNEILYNDNIIEYKIDPIEKKCWHKSDDIKTIPSEYEEIDFYETFTDDIIFSKIEDMIHDLNSSLLKNKRTMFEIEGSNISSKDFSIEKIKSIIGKKEDKIIFLNRILEIIKK